VVLRIQIMKVLKRNNVRGNFMYVIKKKWPIIIFCWILGLASLPVVAAEDPIITLQTVTQRMMNELKKHHDEIHRKPGKIYALVDHIIIPHVDFSEMARWVVGRNAWMLADAETRKSFVQEFKTLVVRSYARSLLEYTDQEIEFLPMREPVGNQKRIQIQSLIKERGKSPIHMNYNLIHEGNKWMVYDIIIEGVSLMQGYRAQFADDIRSGGITLVIEKMHQRNLEN